MKITVRKVLAFILLLAMIYFAVGMLHSAYMGYRAKQNYDKLQNLVQVPNFDELFGNITPPAVSNPTENLPVTGAPTLDTPVTSAPTTEPPVTSAPTNDSPVTSEPPDNPPATPPADTSDDPYATALSTMYIKSLKKINPEVIGWIVIPHTKVSYPLVQGKDNSKYLNLLWDGTWNYFGSIFADYRCDGKLNDFNTIIYGHLMADGTMFGSLKSYKDQSYFEKYPCVYIVTDEKVYRYDIFSSYEANVNNGHTFRLGLIDEGGKQAYINYCLNNSVIKPKSVPTTKDKLITLSTCTQYGYYDYSTRWVVHAYLTYECDNISDAVGK